MLFEIGKIEEANKFYNDYIKTDITINNEDIKQVIKISEGLVLINSDRLKDKIRGQIVIEEALGFSEGKFDQQRNHPYLAQFGILSLIELMLDEIKLYGKVDPINDIYEMLNYLTVQSNKTQNYQNLTSVKIIESRLKILSGDLNQANEILEEALHISSEMKLINLKEQILIEQKHLMAELENWKEILENNVEISIRLEKLKFLSFKVS